MTSVDYNNIFSVDGRVVVVTGCSRGIGSEIAKAYKQRGSFVIGISRSDIKNFKELCDIYYKCDLTNHDNVSIVFESIALKFPNVDVLCNVAGASYLRENYCSDYERFSATVELNLNSAYKVTTECVKLMSSGGSVINVTSICALLGFPDNPGYVASKGGLQALSRSLAVDFANKGIRVNNIVPGYVRTGMTENSYKNPTAFRKRIERTLLGRWGLTSDIAGAALFLGSDASSYMTGSDIVVDGGWSAKGL